MENKKLKLKYKKYFFARWQFFIFYLLFFIFSGCDAMSPNDRPVWQSNKKLLLQKTELETQVRELEAKNKQLTRQVETLSALGKDLRTENLYDVRSINIVNSTGIYNKENKSPQLLLYFYPIDKEGSSIKAAGKVEVQLWNIAGSENESLIDKWEISPAELKLNWGNALMNSFYRLALDLPKNMPEKGDFVVRVSFTDYVSGKVLTARQTITKSLN